MKNIFKNSKRVKLKELLAQRIINGEFSFGERFPGLHQLCNEYDVSYVTANKAMKLLVKEGYLQAKNGVGYFVCYVQPDIIPPEKVVNFITGLTEKSSEWPCVIQGKKLFEESGWKVKLISNTNGNLSSYVADINSPEAYSVLFFTQLNWDIFKATLKHVTQRVVVIGRLSGNSEITNIVSDEYETMRRCINYFRENNRFKTGLITPSPHFELDMLRIAAWRSIMQSSGTPLNDIDKNFLALTDDLQQNKDLIRQIYSDWLKKNRDNIDSIIVPYFPELFIKACHENNIKVPEDIAMICIARSEPFKNDYSIPTLENNFYDHFKFALNIIEERFKTGKKASGSWIFCPPGNLSL